MGQYGNFYQELGKQDAGAIIAFVTGCDINEFTQAQEHRKALSLVHKALDGSPDCKLRIRLGVDTYAVTGLGADGYLTVTPTNRTEKLLAVYVIACGSDWVYAFTHTYRDNEQIKRWVNKKLTKDTWALAKDAIDGRQWHIERLHTGYKEACIERLDELRFTGQVRLAYLTGAQPRKRWDSRERTHGASTQHLHEVDKIAALCKEVGFEIDKGVSLFEALTPNYTRAQIENLIVCLKQGLEPEIL